MLIKKKSHSDEKNGNVTLTWKCHIDAITAKISKTIVRGTYISKLRFSIKRVLLYIY